MFVLRFVLCLCLSCTNICAPISCMSRLRFSFTVLQLVLISRLTSAEDLRGGGGSNCGSLQIFR